MFRLLIASLLCFTMSPGLKEADSHAENSKGENVALLIAAQPDCPLRMREAKFVESENGSRWGATYLVHNTGTKPIRSFSTMILSSFGTGGTLDHFDSASTGKPLLPNQTLKPTDKAVLRDTPSQVVPAHSRIKMIAVIMVGRIVYTDGSVYDAEPEYKALRDYFASLDLERTAGNGKKGL